MKGQIKNHLISELVYVIFQLAVSPTLSGIDKAVFQFTLVRLFLLKENMEQERLNLYYMDMKYIRDLHNADDRVQSVSPQIIKVIVLLSVLL